MRNIYINILDCRVCMLPFILLPERRRISKYPINCVFRY
jgi:hypothetical protein